MSRHGENSDNGRWFKSSHSSGSQGCIEVALTAEITGVRDTKDRDGGTLAFNHEQWASFIASIKL